MSGEEILFEEMHELEVLEDLKQLPWTSIEDDQVDFDLLCHKRDEHVKQCIVELFNIIFWNSLGRNPDIWVPNELTSYNLTFCKQRGMHIRQDPFPNRRLSRSRRSYYIMLLTYIYRLVDSNQTSTKRHIYYAFSEYFEQQTSCNAILRELSALLGIPLVDMRVINTSKTLLAGPLQLQFKDHELDCSLQSNGILLPSYLGSLVAMRSTAKYVLVIEKDSIFQQLVSESKLLSRAILLTGKGYPDVNARYLLRLISDRLQLPLYVLVDCDAYGLEIFCIYRFGSQAMAAHCDQLAVADIRLLGLLPSEVQRLKLTGAMPFGDADWNKLQSLLQRPYVREETSLLNELLILQQIGIKIGLQALNQVEHEAEFLSDYVEKRVRQQEWL